MRISTSQMHNQALNRMLDAQRQVADTQQQISTGRRYQTAADDPVGAVQVERLNTELATRAQYQKNIDLAESELRLEESSLEQAGNLLQRVRELTVQAGNAINTREDRQFIAAEMETRLDELMQLMNTKLASGDYLFGGNAGGQPPFVRDASGAIRYQGDEGQRAVQIDASISLPVNDSGKRLFVDIPAARISAVASAHPNNPDGGTGVLRQPVVVDQDAADAFHPGGLIIEFEPLSEDPGGLPNFTVRRVGDNRVVDGLENVRFEAGEPITVAGMELTLDGAPRVGDRFQVKTTDKQGVLDTIGNLVEGLNSLDGNGEEFQNLVNDSLTNVDNAMSRILETRSEIGARMNVMDSVRSLHDQVKLLSTEAKSDIQDVDFAKAISDLSHQSLVLEAAQKSYARVQRLSLFDAI
jgi:flagellar hook-associated protein 3 FlgL